MKSSLFTLISVIPEFIIKYLATKLFFVNVNLQIKYIFETPPTIHAFLLFAQ